VERVVGFLSPQTPGAPSAPGVCAANQRLARLGEGDLGRRRDNRNVFIYILQELGTHVARIDALRHAY
jgi:hypothetical protein